ncbi:MAG: 4-(cytidine 5'-diphospho)-2-C-methyl-D-erythritol kinase [Rhodospirillaceae bacterium]|nr:MAG: 4-(cytidine 5'-diphospho)-2-C-methyl-D-erythritol kinase [Rhodospirillaceae bacterium]
MTSSRDAVSLPAPAKINLSLHVCGKRADGYHLLDSLVCFAGVADIVTARHANDLRLAISGPFADALSADEDNLVLKAARFLAARDERTPKAHLTLEKHLPVASGIGGGSSDAAATLIACGQLWNIDTASIPNTEIATALGADVPVCLARVPKRMTGIGEHLEPVPVLPPAWLVLVNPQRPLATKAVFNALKGRHSGPAPTLPSRFNDVRDLASYLAACTNDLAAPAAETLPDIGLVLTTVGGATGCLLARLSGSGPTCFGLFGTQAEAQNAAAAIAARQPVWWVVAAPILSNTVGPIVPR